jgi:hypothetical protein
MVNSENSKHRAQNTFDVKKVADFLERQVGSLALARMRFAMNLKSGSPVGSGEDPPTIERLRSQ